MYACATMPDNMYILLVDSTYTRCYHLGQNGLISERIMYDSFGPRAVITGKFVLKRFSASHCAPRKLVIHSFNWTRMGLR